MKNFYYLILIQFSFQLVYAQNNLLTKEEIIDKQIEEAVNLSSEDPVQSILLFTQALEESEKIKFEKGILKCKSSLAILYLNSGEYEKTIKISDDVEILAKKLNDFSSLTSIYRSVSASYALLGLTQRAMENLDKALKYANYIEDKNIRHYRIGLIYDSYSACIQDIKGSPDLILSYIDKSIYEVNQIPDEGTREEIVNAKYDLIGTQYVKLGQLYSESYKDYKKAEHYYLQALEIYENPKFQIISTNQIALLANLSDFYLSQNDFEKSIRHGEEGLKFTHKLEQPELRSQLYNTLFKAYLEVGQKEKSKYYAELYTHLNDSLRQADRSSANTSIEKIIAKKESTYNQSLNIVFSILGVVVLSSIILFFFWRRKNKNIHKKYEAIISKIKSKAENRENDEETDEDIEIKSTITIPDDTVKTLLRKLEKFEKSKLYLQQDMSVVWLSSHLGTNIKYLSELLKIYRNKNFTNYINGLKINYVLNKLVNDPLYRQYKITYLAEECGYASRQVFLSAFKKETGFTPSYFIENLKKEGSKLEYRE